MNRVEESSDEYHFRSEKDGVPLEGEADEEDSMEKEPVVKDRLDFDRMHPDFPETHGYLRKSLSDIEFLKDRIKSMKSERNRDEEPEPVDIRRKEGVDHEVSIDDLKDRSEFKRRKILNKAKILVKRDLVSKGYSKEFLRSHDDLIERKVREFMSD